MAPTPITARIRNNRKNTKHKKIMAYENCELWWVTGAQLLYGGDAVVQVDGHSKEMVEGLNA